MKNPACQAPEFELYSLGSGESGDLPKQGEPRVLICILERELGKPSDHGLENRAEDHCDSPAHNR